MSPGFSALVGNPPWVSYAGRAAQPLDPGVKAYFASVYAAFAGYRNLQGLFIERAADLLHPRGRLGLLLPSSMSEQEGYGPTRAAHNRRCACDAELPDLGEDAFSGVFQPAMVLRSTRRDALGATEDDGPWPVERADLDDEARALIAKMTRPPVPATLFGERGLQTSGEDLDHVADAADARHVVALRTGSDIRAFERLAPSLFADPAHFGRRLRAPDDWREVRLLIRQTATYPIATLSDGVAFRNSILAGFDDPAIPAAMLVAYLNSWPIRWLHFMRHRDARQGMPQMKIGHLRSIPAPMPGAEATALAQVGAELDACNQGVPPDAQRRIDDLVGDMFQLAPPERARIERWARERA